MVSNLSTIGFEFEDDAEFGAVMERLTENSQPRGGAGGNVYSVWRSDDGIEIWFHHDAAGHEITGLTPFYDGKSLVRLKVTERVKRPFDSDFEGALMAWVAPGDSDVGVHPIVFDAVDHLNLLDREIPGTWNARLTGFAHQLKAFPTAEAYNAEQTSEPKFAAQSFVPVGMFASAAVEGDEESIPSSQALLTGRVAEHKLLKNELTGQSFHWLLVDSLEAAFDVVADPNAVEGEITVGGTVEVSCSFFGRALD
jgi:hypothetical protein